MDPDCEVFATRCTCCDDVTYHLPFALNAVSYDPDAEFMVHLTEDEMTSLYFQLKEFKCGLKDPEVIEYA